MVDYLTLHMHCNFTIDDLLHSLVQVSKTEIHNLAHFISVKKFVPLSWQTGHPYILVNRFEYVTPHERVHMNNKFDRISHFMGI